MPHLLALDWDRHEARIAVARKRGRQLVVEHALSIRRVNPGDDQERIADDLVTQLKEVLAEHDISRARTLVAVGRSSVELKQLAVPPAPPSELPDLVRFQAQKEFNTLADDWALDFLPLAVGSGDVQELLTAAIAPTTLARVLETCRSAGLNPRRVVLRPCAAAALLARRPWRQGERIRLLVNPFWDEAELTALTDRQAVFIRNIRLPPAPGPDDVPETDNTRRERRRVLATEIRRTLAAVGNQLGGPRVDAVYLCSSDRDQSDLATQLGRRLALPVHLLDPLADVTLGPALRQTRPADAGRFAPLVGMLLDEAQNVRPGIDFLHPRKAVQRFSRWRVAALAAAAAVLLLGGLFLRTRTELTRLDQQLANTQHELQGLQQLRTQAQGIEKKVAQLDRWTTSDVVWLDELYRLAKQLPPAEAVFLTRVQLVPGAEAGALTLQGRAHSYETIDALERNLRDKHHRIEPKLSQQDRADPRYGWQFKSSVAVTKPESATPVRKKPTRPVAPKPAEDQPAAAQPAAKQAT